MSPLLIVVLLSFVVSAKASGDASTLPPAAPGPECNQTQSLSPSFLDRLRPARQGEVLLLRDEMLQGDSLLRDRLTSRFQEAREDLKAGDARLKEQLDSGDARLKEQLDNVETLLKEELREGDSRVREEISRVEDWVGDRLTRGEARVKERLSEEEGRMKEELKELKDDMTQLLEWARSNLTDLKSRLQEEQERSQTTQSRLDTTEGALQTLQAEVDTLRESREQAESEIASLKVALETAQEGEGGGELQRDTELDGDFVQGSTFVRWGRSACPNNTTLVYSGVAGGSDYDHTGAAANPLCMVMEPEQEAGFVFPGPYTYIYGGEYQSIHGHHQQDVPCSVCRAPHAATIMVPATRTCPSGWAPQYAGYVMAGLHTHAAATEFVCVDKDMEDVHGGHENKNGHLFYYVAATCGSLPCPPYTNNQVIVCVVCSL